MYTIHDYGDMIADRGRLAAYARAIRERLRPDGVVLDLGAGAGILTLLACQAGARKVYAVERDGIIQTARDLVRVNGFADRVELIQAMSTAISLPEPVDLIVADIHSVLPFFAHSPAAIFDARRRFLAPGGAVVPWRDHIDGALVSAPEAYDAVAGPWTSLPGVIGDPGRRRAVNAWVKHRGGAGTLLTPAVRWLDIEYDTGDEINGRGQLRFDLERAGTSHGFCLWFDCETAPGIGFSNSPATEEPHIFGQAFFPWPEPLALEPGDAVEIDLRTDRVGDDYVWTWRTQVTSSGSGETVRYEQGQFESAPISLDWLRKTAGTFTPVPNVRASVDRLALELLVQSTPLEEIAAAVASRFPDRFADHRSALTYVGRLSMKYSE